MTQRATPPASRRRTWRSSDSGGVVFLSSTTQVFGSDIATAMLADADGVPVRVTLCLDNQDQLFELELCKVDFSPIIGVDLRSAFSEH